MDILRAGVGMGALLAGIGVLYNYGVTVPREHAAALQGIAKQEQIVLVSPKTGTRLILSGDGLQLLDKDGHSLAALTQSDGNPQLMLTQWMIRWPVEAEFDLRREPSKPPRTEEGAELDLHPTRVYMTRCPLFTCKDTAVLGLDYGGPALLLTDGDTREDISDFGFSASNGCSDAKSTCYASDISLNDNLGIFMKTCKTERGAPPSTADKDDGCESVHISSTQVSDVSKGARIVLREDGRPRLVIGRAILTSPAVGGQEITPISQITAFDKKGAVVWRMPGR